MAQPRFQIMSDLHLETPLSRKSYRRFEMNIDADYLCLLGDIGLVQDNDLLWFLETILQKFDGLTVFYVVGNHEPYQISLQVAHKTMRAFEDRMRRYYGQRFFTLNRTRYDIHSKLTVLGCTLWSFITDEQARDVWQILTDFNPERGIRDWDVLSHREEHQKDLEWLNNQVSKIEDEDPGRQIIILTHHSPTFDERINDPRHKNSNVTSGFVTDLSQEVCWKSPNVRCWAFGHTHYSGHYHEEGTGKLVYSNQRGYSSFGAANQPVVRGQVVKPSDGVWAVTNGVASSRIRAPPAPKPTPTMSKQTVEGGEVKTNEKSTGILGKMRNLFR